MNMSKRFMWPSKIWHRASISPAEVLQRNGALAGGEAPSVGARPPKGAGPKGGPAPAIRVAAAYPPGYAGLEIREQRAEPSAELESPSFSKKKAEYSARSKPWLCPPLGAGNIDSEIAVRVIGFCNRFIFTFSF